MVMSITPQAVQDLLDELEVSRASRKRAWEILQEIRWALKDAAGMELPPPPARKKIDLKADWLKNAFANLSRIPKCPHRSDSRYSRVSEACG